MDTSSLLPITEMRALDFVQWDRFAAAADRLTVYGWIHREEDGRHDFVVLTATPNGIGFVTSSSRWSAEISRRLGSDGRTHRPCQRVEWYLGAEVLSNAVRLEPETNGPLAITAAGLLGAESFDSEEAAR